uniref:Uncharacterized protein n=1 Tax=viral metagenome TaxID=1070528 RepID=A0A6C0CJT4_9ZZZZ
MNVTPTGVFSSKSDTYLTVYIRLEEGEGCIEIKIEPGQTKQEKEKDILHKVANYLQTLYDHHPNQRAEYAEDNIHHHRKHSAGSNALSEAYVKLLYTTGNLKFGKEFSRIIV